MTLPSPALEIFGIYDRGVPNSERIVLRANEAVNLSQYGIVLGFSGTNNIFPITDQFLWLGDIYLAVPGWVFIFTGTGQPSVSQEQHTREPVQNLYWNKPYVILGAPNVVPALFQFGTVLIGNTPNKSIADLQKAHPSSSMDSDELMRLMGGTVG